jgi:predicted deacylase
VTPSQPDRPALDITPAPPGYHSEAQFEAALDAAAERAGARVERRVVGTSVEGRPLHALTVAAPGRTPSSERPHAVVQGGMHGIEVIGTELALHLLDALTTDAPSASATALLEACDVTVLPCVNPDGRRISLASVTAPGPRAPASRRNANGVDLNRNWPRPAGVRNHWLPVSGTGIRWLPWYRGPSPSSEPETAAVMAFLAERPPAALLDLHSCGQILVYPWTSKREIPADEAGYWQMIDALRARQRTWTYRAKQSRDWYPIVGSMDDYAYDEWGTLMVTVEVGQVAGSVKRRPWLLRRSFWLTNPLDVAPHLANDGEGCLDALLAGVRYRIVTPSGAV